MVLFLCRHAATLGKRELEILPLSHSRVFQGSQDLMVLTDYLAYQVELVRLVVMVSPDAMAPW